MDKKRRGINDNILKTDERGIIEDATEYGEFVPSYNAWITLDEQRARAKYLEELSDEIKPD